MNLDSKKLYIILTIPTIIIAAVLFILETIITGALPIISLIGFAVLLAIGGFTYFSGTKKAQEEKKINGSLKSFLIFMAPTVVVSTILFLFVDPPDPPYLLVYGLAVLLIAYSAIFFWAVKIATPRQPGGTWIVCS